MKTAAAPEEEMTLHPCPVLFGLPIYCDDLYIKGAVCVSVSKSHYLLGKLFWQVNFFS